MTLRTLRWALLLYAAFDFFMGYGGLFPLTELAAAQFTTVTGTVTDPNGVPYANGTITASLIISGTPTFTSGGFQYSPPMQPSGLSASGVFVMQLADVTALTPGGGTWTFTVCSAIGTVQPAGGKGPVCFTVAGIAITGTSQDIGPNLRAVAPALIATGVPATGGPPPITSISSFGISVLAAGDNALYTVPANKLALVRLFAFNSTAGAITVFPTITPNGGATIFRIGANVALPASGTNASDTNYQLQTYLLASAGDVIGLNATALGVNAHGVVLLLDIANTSTYKQVILTTFAIGDNTIYTVPAGKIAYLAYTSLGPLGTVGTQLLYTNETGGNTTISLNLVPSGGSVAASNRVFAPSLLANGSASVITMIKKMAAGDFLSLNTTSAGKQFFTCIVLEMTP